MMAFLLGIYLLGAGVGGVAAQDTSPDSYICTMPTGQSRLIWSGAPEQSWENCARRIPVVAEGFTRTKLTFALSAAYDPRTNQFSNVAAGSTSEYIRPGEHIVVLGAHLQGRNLSYSLSTNTFRFVNVIDIETKLIYPSEYRALMVDHDAEQLFITVHAADFFTDSQLTKNAQIGGNRIVAWRGNQFDNIGREYVLAECLRPAPCRGAVGWIPKTSLSEITKIERTTGAFPMVFEYPTSELEKRCNVASKVISSAEIKSVIQAKASFTALASAELTASIEAALKTVREDTYDRDVKVERTIFTVFKFRSPYWWETKRWYPNFVRVLILDKVTIGCNSATPLEYFELRTDDGSYEITTPSPNSDITSSVVYARFVAQAQARTRGRVKVWALGHIASALSAIRR
jgi:hypothetical protein